MIVTTASASSRSDPSLRFGPLFFNVVEAMRAEFGDRMTSVLVGGSVSQNDARDDSDVDVFVTFDGTWRQRRRMEVAGLEVDLFINPTALVRANLSRARDPVLVYNYADGWAIFDPANIIDGFQKLARKAWSAPRALPTDLQVFVHANKMRDARTAIQRAFGRGRTHEAYLMSDFVESIIAAYYVFARRWRPPQKGLIADLQLTAPTIAKAIEIAYDPLQPIETRTKAVTSLHEIVLDLFEPARACVTGPRLRVPD